MSTSGLARLSVLKRKLDITATTYDDTLKNHILTATRALEMETDRKLTLQSFTDERYTAYPNTKRLLLKNYPVTGTPTVKFGTSAISGITLCSSDDAPYLIYEGAWSQTDSNILVSYTAGYDCNGWDTLTEVLDSGDTFNVPADIEDAIADYAAVIFKRSNVSEGRLGINSVQRSGESLGYTSYSEGYPESFRSVIERHRRYYG